MTSGAIKEIARECGFELAGVASADAPLDFARYEAWVAAGFAGEMRYLTDRRADVRRDVRNLLPTARSVICVGKLYRQEKPASHISQYAWGRDYHLVLREGLEQFVRRLSGHAAFDWKICVDTAPLLERSFARMAGLGWIGKNTCLINEPQGSWFFLGELITSLELEPDSPPPDRCGTCSRCIDACPTGAFVLADESWTIDSRLCISYLTIELRGTIPEEQRASIGPHTFGCDICQDVCPWNSRAPVTRSFKDTHHDLSLEACAQLSESQFKAMFRDSPIARARYSGFLRNVAIAMGNIGAAEFLEPLQQMTHHPDPVVAEHAQWALWRLKENSTVPVPEPVYK